MFTVSHFQQGTLIFLFYERVCIPGQATPLEPVKTSMKHEFFINYTMLLYTYLFAVKIILVYPLLNHRHSVIYTFCSGYVSNNATEICERVIMLVPGGIYD